MVFTAEGGACFAGGVLMHCSPPQFPILSFFWKTNESPSLASFYLCFAHWYKTLVSY